MLACKTERRPDMRVKCGNTRRNRHHWLKLQWRKKKGFWEKGLRVLLQRANLNQSPLRRAAREARLESLKELQRKDLSQRKQSHTKRKKRRSQYKLKSPTKNPKYTSEFPQFRKKLLIRSQMDLKNTSNLIQSKKPNLQF